SLVVSLSPKTGDGRMRFRVPLIVLVLVAGLAAVTRTQSQIVLLSIVLASVCLTRLRLIRPLGWAILIGVVLATGAWGTRNYLVLGSFDVGSSHDGKTLFESNCSYTRQGIRTLGVVGGFLEECSRAQLEHIVTLDEVEADRQFRRYALAYIASNPMDVARTAGFKLLVSLSGFAFRSPVFSLRNVGAVGSSLLMLTLGAYGLWRLWRQAPRPPHVIALFIIGAVMSGTTLLMLLIGPTGLRYRIGVAGFLFLGVGAIVMETLSRRAVARTCSLSSPMKRAFDALLAGTGLVVSLPLWIAFAIAIKFEDGGDVFYGHERVGRGGRRFYVWKFRSMIPNAEAAVGPVQAHADDPRITKVGRWLRATALDELPQLWSIFRGDMSFVGPRALRPGEIEVQGDGRFERLEDVPGFERRCIVRPGLTGIAQIYAPRDIPRRQKFRYDGLYLRQQGLALDLRLILLSFWITFRGSWESRDRKF
ncbi:MAG: sugar transferase, partial [Vicinamibacterales bacterium]